MPVPSNLPLPGTIGNVDDTTSLYSPFGPPTSNTSFVKSTENPDEQVRNVSNAGNRKITPDDDISATKKSYVGAGPTLYYPVENSNPAYQARVTFKVHSLQTKMDGETLKGFTKHVTDNLKTTSKSEDIDPGGDVFGQDVYSDGFEEYGEDFADASGVGVLTAYRQQDTFPSDHGANFGHLGINRIPFQEAALSDCDLLIAMGTRMDSVTVNDYTMIRSNQKLVMVYPEPSEFSQWQADVAIASNVLPALEALTKGIAAPSEKRIQWHRESIAKLQGLIERMIVKCSLEGYTRTQGGTTPSNGSEAPIQKKRVAGKKSGAGKPPRRSKRLEAKRLEAKRLANRGKKPS